jgi:LPXTG-motif cell wall-anchored protein
VGGADQPRTLWRAPMDTNTLLIIVILFLLLGGGGFFYSRRGV